MGTTPARDTKSLLLRLDATLAERVQAIAEVEGRSTSDVVREALGALVDARRRDPVFAGLLRENLKRHEELLRLLADDEL